jgi:hypothetical protein
MISGQIGEPRFEAPPLVAQQFLRHLVERFDQSRFASVGPAIRVGVVARARRIHIHAKSSSGRRRLRQKGGQPAISCTALTKSK